MALSWRHIYGKNNLELLNEKTYNKPLKRVVWNGTTFTPHGIRTGPQLERETNQLAEPPSLNA
jgi:hypothetical protein